MGSVGWSTPDHITPAPRRRVEPRGQAPNGRKRRWRRRLSFFIGTLLLVGTTAGGALGYLTVSATAGSAGAATAGSIAQVTGLTLGAGAVTPTANRNVPLSWNATTVANSESVTGYVVNRYDSSNVLQPGCFP